MPTAILKVLFDKNAAKISEIAKNKTEKIVVNSKNNLKFSKI